MGSGAWRLSLLAVLVAALALPPAAAFPEDAKEKYKEIQQQIKEQKRKLQKAEKLEGVTLTELDRANRRLNEVENELRRYKARLRKTESEIVGVEAEIAGLEKKIAQRREWIKRRLRYMYMNGMTGDVLVVLGTSEDLSQLLRRWRYLEALAAYEKRVVDGFREDLAALGRTRDRLESLRADLRDQKAQVERTRESVEARKEQKAQLLAAVRKERAAYEKMLKDLKAASTELLKIIQESERLQYAGQGFRGLKGRLPWPVEGRVAIPYGTQKDLRFDTPVFRNGVYIEVPEESVARAVHGGRVVFADWFKGYGQLVIVNHGGGYHSLYANLSEIFLKAGDIIEGNAQVGRVGESNVFNKSALYFEIRYKGKPLDPAQWLKRR
ncbi:MAG: peptidoglycan DD-metalloendopeptidase family protein [Thermodesulfovibrionales bacterium]